MKRTIKLLGFDCSTELSIDGHSRAGGAEYAGNVTRLLLEALDAANDEGDRFGVDVDLYSFLVWEKFPKIHPGPFNYRLPGAEDIYQLIEDADGFLFATPVAWFNANVNAVNMMAYLIAFDHTPALTSKPFCAFSHFPEAGGKAAELYIVGAMNNMGCPLPRNGTSFQNPFAAAAGGGEDHRQLTEHRTAARNVVRSIIESRTAKEHGFESDWGPREEDLVFLS